MSSLDTLSNTRRPFRAAFLSVPAHQKSKFAGKGGSFPIAFLSPEWKSVIVWEECIIRNETEPMRQNCITRRIGRTLYTVNVAFSEKAKESLEDKILRMIQNEVSTNASLCDTMKVSQMSCSA